MTDAQRVTAADVRREVEALANTGMGLTLTEWCRISERLLAGADAIDTAQSQAATIAELRAEVERLKSAAQTAHYVWGDDLKKLDREHARAEAAESALATATARIEKMKAALRKAGEKFNEYAALHAAKPDMDKSKRNADMAIMCFAALQEDAPHG